MQCPNCQVDSPEGKKFCGDCGTPFTPLMLTDQQVRSLVDEQMAKIISAKLGGNLDSDWITKSVDDAVAKAMATKWDFNQVAARVIQAETVKKIIDDLTQWGKWILLLTGLGAFGLLVWGYFSVEGLKERSKEAQKSIDTVVVETTKQIQEAGGKFQKEFDERNQRGRDILERIETLETQHRENLTRLKEEAERLERAKEEFDKR